MLRAFFRRRGGLHEAAIELLKPVLDGARGTPAITDYLVDEVLTFLVAKGATRSHVDRAIAFLLGDRDARGPFALHRVGPDHFATALDLLRRHRARRLSFTDCTSLAVMATAGIPTIASFDRGFDGLVVRIGAAEA